MKLTWLTDLHLDCVELSYIENFFESLNTDAILITGDIAKSNSFYKHLKRIQILTNAHVYFVLGNHDLYKGGFKRSETKAVCITNENLTYLTNSNVIKLNETTTLVGEDGWYDFDSGPGLYTPIKVQDFKRIEEFKRCHYLNIVNLSKQRSQVASRKLKDKLEIAIQQGYKNIYIATHFPPFPGAALSENGKIDTDWLPLSISVAMGKMLAIMADNNADVNFTVYAGHTHSQIEYKHFDNLKVLVGKAEYGKIFISGEINL